jgi:uncharacterized protein
VRRSFAVRIEEKAMSAANIAFVQSLYAAFRRGDIDAIVAATSPDVRWEAVGRPTDFPVLAVRKGHDGVREFFRLLGETQDIVQFEPRDFHAADAMVFVSGHYAWTLRKTGKRVASDWLHVFAIADGKVTAFRDFTDTARFAEAYRG